MSLFRFVVARVTAELSDIEKLNIRSRSSWSTEAEVPSASAAGDVYVNGVVPDSPSDAIWAIERLLTAEKS